MRKFMLVVFIGLVLALNLYGMISEMFEAIVEDEEVTFVYTE